MVYWPWQWSHIFTIQASKWVIRVYVQQKIWHISKKEQSLIYLLKAINLRAGWGNHWVNGIDQEAPADTITINLSDGGGHFCKDNKCQFNNKMRGISGLIIYELTIIITMRAVNRCHSLVHHWSRLVVSLSGSWDVWHRQIKNKLLTVGACKFPLWLIYEGLWWQSNLGSNKCGYKWQQHKLCAVCAQLTSSINILMDASWLNIWVTQIGLAAAVLYCKTGFPAQYARAAH